jgi:diguanylate cyclase (GGDEF)-like protein
MVWFYLFSIDKVGDIYIDKAHDTIYGIKEDLLKDTVNNLISEIDMRREAKAKHLDKFMTRTTKVINMKAELNDAEFNEFFINFFSDNPDYDSVTVVLWSNTEQKSLYDPQNLAKDSFEETLEAITKSLSTYRIILHGNETALLGVSKNYLEEAVKSDVAEVIRNTKFDGESYIWVNEIINYDGGDNYAIRRIHPNLPDTEGTYLSTNTKDIKGNLPYLTELQGINRNGELFFRYYFKELNSEEISEKLTYAKLYKDYNWVIAMGIYLSDLEPYFEQTNQESKALVSRLTLILVLLFIMILIISLCSIALIEKLYYRHSKRLMESEINQDPLTKADSRRSGNNELATVFHDFLHTGKGPGIVICDIDEFKGINDKYGHAFGDLVLVEFVKEIKNILKGTGKIIRWGGDEFIIIFFGVTKDNAIGLGNKILEATSNLKVSDQHKDFKFTISMGLSFFKESDNDYNDVIKRADGALYQSKTNGRNQINMLL